MYIYIYIPVALHGGQQVIVGCRVGPLRSSSRGTHADVVVVVHDSWSGQVWNAPVNSAQKALSDHTWLRFFSAAGFYSRTVILCLSSDPYQLAKIISLEADTRSPSSGLSVGQDYLTGSWHEGCQLYFSLGGVYVSVSVLCMWVSGYRFGFKQVIRLRVCMGFVCVFYVDVLALGVCSGNLTVRFVASNVALGAVALSGCQVVR
jgi:hypothetical protein